MTSPALADLSATRVRLMRYIAVGYVTQSGPGRRNPGTIHLDLPGGGREQNITAETNSLIARGLVEVGEDLSVRLTTTGNEYMAAMGFVCQRCAAGNHDKCSGYASCDCQHRTPTKE
jgi:hypothetical protein